MKRTCKNLLLLPLLVALILPQAAAANDGTVALAAQFQQDGYLYVFAALEEWPDGLTVELCSGDLAREIPCEGQPQRTAESDTPVSYLLLVDCSTSMAGFQKRVTDLTKRLTEADKTDAIFTIATFGEMFRVEGCGLSGEEAVAVIETISYVARRSDISQGILDAMEYFRSCRRQTGELLNLVVVTDGIPMYSEDSPALSEIAQELEEEPSILIHTFGFGSSQARLNTLASLGRGVHVSGQAAKGAEIAQYVNELCIVSFPWNLEGLRSAGELRFTWENKGEAFLPVNLNLSPLSPNGTEANVEEPLESAPPSEDEVPEITELPSEQPTGAASETIPVITDETSAKASPALNEAELNDDKKTISPMLWAILTIALLLLLLAALACRKRKRHKSQQGGIPMCLEVLSGTLVSKIEILYLRDELIIGRGNRCDISWRDHEVSRQNSRIFLKNQMIYIEDLGSASGTALGGMRLHSPNRLRSGDEISIGPVRFILRF